MTRLYFAGAESYPELIKKVDVKNILVSYFSIKNISYPKVFLDSGAFSAFTQNKKVDIDKYIQFIKDNQDQIETYASLDVIGNPDETYKNFRYMKDKGLNPVPCFHIAEDFKYLKQYLAEGEEYIALGGMVPYATKEKLLRRWLIKCFSIIPKEVKIHGFGMTNPRLISTFPFYSVDSTSWLYGARYGYFYFFDKGNIWSLGKDRFHKTYNKQFNKLGSETITKWNLIQWKKFADFIEEEKI